MRQNETDLASLERAVQGFRSPEAFLDYGQYVKNLNSIVRYYDLLGALSYPAENIGFLQRHRGRYSTFNLRDLLDADLGTLVCFPFEKYFYQRVATDPDFRDSDLIGISIVYDHQLYHALHFARLIKRAWPEKKLILGGTSISQIYKHLKSKDLMKRFFELCDAIVIGEGETAICEIMAGGGCFDGSQTFMNTILYDKGRDQLILPPIRYESVPPSALLSMTTPGNSICRRRAELITLPPGAAIGTVAHSAIMDSIRTSPRHLGVSERSTSAYPT